MQKVITHSGSFHADDVFAVATLQIHFGVDNIEVTRTREENIISEGDIVVDVGGVYDPAQQRFDHHQNGVPSRENGIPYAAFGLVWKHYGEEVSGSNEVATALEERLVLPIDAGDNGIAIYDVNEKEISPITIQSIFGLLRPEWGSDSSIDDVFLEACELARKIIHRAIAHSKASLEEGKVASAAYEKASNDKKVIVSEEPVSASFFLDYPEPLFLICPENFGSNTNWTAKTIKVSHNSFESRMQFPEEWNGLRDDELVEASGIEDAIFCHKARFIFVAKSKEGALLAVEKTLNKK